MALCRHCDHRQVHGSYAARGLCETCANKPHVRDKYPLPPKPPPDDPCRHCRRRKAARGKRGLCHACRNTPEVAALYPPPEARVSEIPAVCRHCRKANTTRPRGLCWACYYTPAVRAMYGPIGKFGVRPNADDAVGLGLEPPADHTDHPPGSPGKVAVLTRRFARRTSLWHPADARTPI